MARPGALHVEFLGLPGSGKSTLAHAVAGRLRAQSVAVSEPTYVVTHATTPPLRQLAKLGHVGLGAINRPGDTLSWLRLMGRLRQPTAAQAGALGVNWLYVLRLARRYAGRAGIHLFDQGLLQAWWSLVFEAHGVQAADPEGWSALTACWPHRAVIVRVAVGPDTARRRLPGRPGPASRMERALSTGHWEEAFARGAAALERVDALARQLAERTCTTIVRIDNDADHALDQNAAALTDTLLERYGPAPRSPALRAVSAPNS